MRWLLALATTAALLGSAAASAQDLVPVPPLTGRVVDETATLTPPQSQALSAKLEAIETQRGAQIVVLIVPTTAPEDIAAFTQRAGDRYKIGRRGIGDGLLIVVAKNDRRVTIAPAKALEGAVPDILANRIISEQITPAFKAGDFAGGLNQAVDRIGQAIAGEGLAPPSPRSQGTARRASRGFDFQDIAIFLFVGVPILGGILTRLFGRKGGAVLAGGAIAGIGWLLTTSLLVAGGAGLAALLLIGVMGGGFGSGGGGGGGGGFSSGGGGDFGGGGASGSW
jgi:uncharacterized protein